MKPAIPNGYSPWCDWFNDWTTEETICKCKEKGYQPKRGCVKCKFLVYRLKVEEEG